VDADSGLVTAALLRAAGRDEAFRYGPDASLENQAAIDAIAGIDFDAYPYTAILVPGQGPTDDTTALNPAGINRINTAVARWRAGLAPLLLVSGGHVHPDKTPFCEAIEMRRYLIDELGIPAAAIVVDPYARHTTTNLRNAASCRASACRWTGPSSSPPTFFSSLASSSDSLRAAKRSSALCPGRSSPGSTPPTPAWCSRPIRSGSTGATASTPSSA
jgi:hypothetical protein